MRGSGRHVIRTSHFAQDSAGWLAERLAELGREKSTVSLAVSGGATPREVHVALSRLGGVPWEAIHVYFGDERCVPPDHPDSNYRMARESLLDRVPIPASNVHWPVAEVADHDAAASAYEAILPETIDLVVLGIGEDGHTASLFPRSPALAETERRYVPVVGPKPPPERLTLTPRSLAAAGTLVVLAKGRGKADAVARALHGPWDPGGTPAQLAREGVWFVDTEAAGNIASHQP
jgi:6-phosphogluconolactonase